MQTSITAHLRTVEFKPHYDMFRSQQSNYRASFRFTKNANGNINMNFSFGNDGSSHLSRVVDFSKTDMTIQEFEKFIDKRDVCGKAVVSEFKKGNIGALMVKGTLSVGWPTYPKTNMFNNKLDDIIKETTRMNPGGPRVWFTTSLMYVFGDNLASGHKSFPAKIKITRQNRNWGEEYPLLAARPSNDGRDCQYRMEIEYHNSENPTVDPVFQFNSQTGAPTICRFDYYGKTVDEIASLLYTYNNKKIIDFFTALQNRTTVHKAEYIYDGKIIPHEMLTELRFPLDDAQEFDLMMRLE